MEPSNVLKIESLESDWHDKDSVMLHASFQLLKDCVEKEKLLDCHIDWEYDKKFSHAKKELQELYTWWLSYHQVEKESAISKEELYQLENKMFHRLIDVRWALWT